MFAVRLSTRLITVMLGLLTLTACIHPYTPPVQQGNVITADELSQLKIGMSKDEVQYLIGSPVLVDDDLNPDEWNYVYTFKSSYNAPMTMQKMTLIFKNGNLVDIEGGLKALGKAQKPIT